ILSLSSVLVFVLHDTATTLISTLSLHDALPISTEGRWKEIRDHTRGGPFGPEGREGVGGFRACRSCAGVERTVDMDTGAASKVRSEEHTSELQSRENLVCRLLLEKKKQQY